MNPSDKLLTDGAGDQTAGPREVGERLRELRMGRRMTLKVVAERAGVSESFLSQVERGRSSPSLKTLQALAHALGIEVGDMLDVRGFDRPFLMPRESIRSMRIGSLTKRRITPSAVTSVEIIGAIFDAGGTTGEAYAHGDSDEIFIVVSGRAQAEVDGQIFDMGPGDSLCYRSSMPHAFHNPSDEPADVLWVMSPPSY